jgi:hypothetical protein
MVGELTAGAGGRGWQGRRSLLFLHFLLADKWDRGAASANNSSLLIGIATSAQTNGSSMSETLSIGFKSVICPNCKNFVEKW